MTDSRLDPASKPRFEQIFETGIFQSRWLITPIYVGLIVVLGALVVAFVRDTWVGLSSLFSLTLQETMMMALALIDASLVGNLLLIVIFSGYENFVSKIDTADHEDRPDWMGAIDFANVKMKVIGSIVAISAVAMLRAFIHLSEGGPVDREALMWMMAMLLTFVLAGLLLAAMDWVNWSSRKNR